MFLTINVLYPHFTRCIESNCTLLVFIPTDELKEEEENSGIYPTYHRNIYKIL